MLEKSTFAHMTPEEIMEYILKHLPKHSYKRAGVFRQRDVALWTLINKMCSKEISKRKIYEFLDDLHERGQLSDKIIKIFYEAVKDSYIGNKVKKWKNPKQDVRKKVEDHATLGG